MAGKRKSTKKTKTQEVAVNEAVEQPVGPDLGPDPEIEISTNIVPTPAEMEEIITEKQKTETKKQKTETEKQKTETKKQKFNTGDIVFIAKKAEADLNGFKLFPQYKKYAYTVEAYDQISGVYTLRRLNLSLRLPESLILAPEERAHDPLNRKQF